MIHQIEIQNFESHKDTVVKLAGNTTGIVGDSEHGKSAIFRAVYWLAFNRHLGTKSTSDNYRSHWGGITRVTLVLENGYRISKIRSKTKNSYVIRYPTGKKKALSGFGLQVPDEITKILGLQNLNFQNQFLFE